MVSGRCDSHAREISVLCRERTSAVVSSQQKAKAIAMRPTLSSGMRHAGIRQYFLVASLSASCRCQLHSHTCIALLPRIACQTCCCTAKAHFPLCRGTEIHISASKSLGTVFSASMHFMALSEQAGVMRCSQVYAKFHPKGEIFRYCAHSHGGT